MTQDEILYLAEKCGMRIFYPMDGVFSIECLGSDLFKFANQVRNQALEEAAALVDERHDECEPWMCGDDVRSLKK